MQDFYHQQYYSQGSWVLVLTISHPETLSYHQQYEPKGREAKGTNRTIGKAAAESKRTGVEGSQSLDPKPLNPKRDVSVLWSRLMVKAGVQGFSGLGV